MIIGLAGYAGTGKTTFANFMRKNTTDCVVYSFAYPLKKACSVFTGYPIEYFMSRELKSQILPEYGKTPRQIMQIFGTECVRDLIHEDLWVINMERAIRKCPHKHVIIDDVRRENEARLITETFGGVVLKLVRDGIEPESDHSSERIDIKDFTEIHLSDSLIMAEIVATDVALEYFKE